MQFAKMDVPVEYMAVNDEELVAKIEQVRHPPWGGPPNYWVLIHGWIRFRWILRSGETKSSKWTLAQS